MNSKLRQVIKMATTMELNIARKKLIEALGDDSKSYFSTMKLWFRRKISKDEFDSESRKYLASESVHLHNEFLLAILNKCQSWTSTHASSKETTSSFHSTMKDKLKKGKVKKKSRLIRATFEHRFQPVNPLLCVPAVVARDPNDDNRVSFCAREATLPDKFMIHGRMFVTAWDSGLDAVDDEAVHLVLAAVEQHLKTVLMAVLTRRHSYKLRSGHFVHSIGTTLPNTYLISHNRRCNQSSESHPTEISDVGEHVPSLKPTTEYAETERHYSTACGIPTAPVLLPVSLYDLHEALQVHKKAIPSNTVYAVNMERLSARLWHPNHEELNQEYLHAQEEKCKQELAEQTFIDCN